MFNGQSAGGCDGDDYLHHISPESSNGTGFAACCRHTFQAAFRRFLFFLDFQFLFVIVGFSCIAEPRYILTLYRYIWNVEFLSTKDISGTARRPHGHTRSEPAPLGTGQLQAANARGCAGASHRSPSDRGRQSCHPQAAVRHHGISLRQGRLPHLQPPPLHG